MVCGGKEITTINMKANSSKIRKKATESILGAVEMSIKVTTTPT